MNTKLLTATNATILVTILFFGVQNIVEHGSIVFGLNHNFILHNLWFQPLSTIFTHGGLMHLAMNMFVLFQFGHILENNLGTKSFLIIYFLGGIFTSLLAFIFIYYFELNHNLVGASGAISVLLGYYAYKVKHERTAILIWIILISFAPMMIGINVAWYAHLIGFALGWLFGYIK